MTNTCSSWLICVVRLYDRSLIHHVSKHLSESWVMSHIWMSHVSHMNESCLTYEWVMSHIWMSPSSIMDRGWALLNRLDKYYTAGLIHIWVTNYMYLSRTTYRWWIDDLSNRWRLHHRWSIQLTNVTYETRTTCMSLSNRRTTHMSHELHVWVYPIDEIHIWVTNYMYESIQ